MNLINKIIEFIVFIIVSIIALPFLILASPIWLFDIIQETLRKRFYKFKGYNIVFYPSAKEAFNNYILNKLKEISYINIYKMKRRYGCAYIRIIDEHIDTTFNLCVAERKFLYNSTKIDNVLKKISEYARRYSSKNFVKHREELNLSNSSDGFGYIQEQILSKNQKRDKEDSGSNYIGVGLIILFILILLILGRCNYNKKHNPALSNKQKQHYKELVDKYYGSARKVSP